MQGGCIEQPQEHLNNVTARLEAAIEYQEEMAQDAFSKYQKGEWVGYVRVVCKDADAAME